ncbi:hypothetical protein PDR5_40230 [Pseudomonas sp. DR 5-09]|nr:hypothetical protein PDR5_40230 [Pseudomonas sp. DR 5-09]
MQQQVTFAQENPDISRRQSAFIKRNYLLEDVAGRHELFNCDFRL